MSWGCCLASSCGDGLLYVGTTGRSIVCDVNGWSFVKGNQRYYDDCAILVQKFFLDRFHITFTMPIPALKNVGLGGSLGYRTL